MVTATETMEKKVTTVTPQQLREEAAKLPQTVLDAFKEFVGWSDTGGCTRTGWSLSVLESRTGVSGGAWSKWFRGKYDGNNVKIDDAARRLMNFEQQRAMLPPMPKETATTVVTNKLNSTCQAAIFSGWVGAFIAPAGSGVSTACAAFVQQNSGCKVIHATAWRRGSYSMARHAARAFSPQRDIPSGYEKQMEFLCEELTPKGEDAKQRRLILVDDAELLTLSALRLWTDLNHTAKVPVVLAGDEHLLRKLQRNSKIAERVKICTHVHPHAKTGRLFTREQVDELTRIYLPHATPKDLDDADELANGEGHISSLCAHLAVARILMPEAGKDHSRALRMANRRSLCAPRLKE